MRGLILTLSVVLAASPALAGPVTLKANPVDDDGRVTLGDLFDGAGAAAGVTIGQRAGPSIVFDAGALQSQALRAGLEWSNPQGLRRVVVRAAAAAPVSASAAGAPAEATVQVLTYARNLSAGDVIQPEDVIWTAMQAHMAPSGGLQDADQAIGLTARRPLRMGAAASVHDLTQPQVIARNDAVEVAYEVGGVKLTVTGRAVRNAARGEPVQVTNAASGKIIDAVAVGPGQAIAGPAAQAARAASPSTLSAR